MVPPAMLLHMLLSLGSQVRPDPPGRYGRNAVCPGPLHRGGRAEETFGHHGPLLPNGDGVE